MEILIKSMLPLIKIDVDIHLQKITKTAFPTFQPIRLSTNFMTLIPSLTFTDYEWFPWSICNGCCMPAGNAYPSRHLVPSPNCGTCLCSNCWDQIPRTCDVFNRLFTSNTPWFFLGFARQSIKWTNYVKTAIPNDLSMQMTVIEV